jgi:ATP-dependent protease ClpP protease subunit
VKKPKMGPSLFNRSMSQSGNKSWYRVVNATDKTPTRVYIYDEIGMWGVDAQSFADEINGLDVNEFELHINSPGGDLFDGIAIYNAVKQHKAKVKGFVDALAASAASFIFMAADERIVTRNATLMIHDGIALTYGNEEAHLYTAGLLSKFSDNIADIYAFNAGGTVEEWRALMREEVWYSAREAVDAGLADMMLDEEDLEAETATNNWNLSVFNYEGRDKAPSPASVVRAVKNQLKENTVSGTTAQPKATTQQPEPEAPVQPTGDPANPASPDQPETPAEPTPAAPAPAAPATPPANSITGANGQVTFQVNGQTVTDPTAIQNHISNLERFQTETKKAARQSFVENLASPGVNKILASQIDSTMTFVESLSDEQFEAWKATWNVAGSISSLQPSGVSPANPSGDQTSVEAQNAQHLQDLKDTVRQHKLGGMPVSQIEKTESYMQLKVLDPTYTL